MTQSNPDAPQPSSNAPHAPVLTAEVLDALNPQPGETYIDLTVGAGGHCSLVAERIGETGHIIAFDRDDTAIAVARERLKSFQTPIRFIHSPFDALPGLVESGVVPKADIVLADFGVSSMMLDIEQRGFSFRTDAPLDMRMDLTTGLTAADWLNSESETDIANAIFQNADERFSRRIARRIVEERRITPIQTTGQLAAIVESAYPYQARKHLRIHPATRTFQAIRIVINDELGQIERLLSSIDVFLNPGGRFACISFHSLEDRLVKNTFKNLHKTGRYTLWTRKPVRASDDETSANPRARSALLRAIACIPAQPKMRRR
ncbi:MAG: 16S rRNA (cytosine(1402)-N(4))-methyltransferase RsmH [Planctomycetota bacterium]